MVDSIRRALPPWSVNQVAQAAGMAALADVSFRHRSQQFMQQERIRFVRQLRSIVGLRVIPSQANFVMVEICEDLEIEHIVLQLQNQGILVRDCQSFSGVTKPALRFAVRLRRENQQLIEALTMIVKDFRRQDV